MTLGKDLIVSIDGVAVAGAKSCSFKIEQQMIDSCSPTEGRTFDKIPTTYSWGLSVDCLIPNSYLPNNLIDLLIAGTQVFISFTDGSNQKRAGYAYLKNCDENGSVGSLAKFSASFEGSGPLYKYVQYTPATFTEGSGIVINKSGSSVLYYWDEPDSLSGVGFTSTKDFKLRVRSDNVTFAIYSKTFSSVKTDLTNHNSTSLNNALVYVGIGNDTISLSHGTYTILCNDDGDPLFAFSLV